MPLFDCCNRPVNAAVCCLGVCQSRWKWIFVLKPLKNRLPDMASRICVTRIKAHRLLLLPSPRCLWIPKSVSPWMGEVLGGKNVFLERLYRTIKNEEVFLYACWLRAQGSGNHLKLLDLLQYQTPAFVARSPDTQSGLLQLAAATPGHSLTRVRIYL